MQLNDVKTWHVLSLYLEVSIICSIILGLLAVKALRGPETPVRRKRLSAFLFGVVIYSILCIVWNYETKGAIHLPQIPYKIFCVFDIMIPPVFSFYWYAYVEAVLSSDTDSSYKLPLWPKLLLLADLILCIVSCFNGCLFNIDKDGNYTQSPLMAIEIVFGYVYFVVPMYKCIREAHKKDRYAQRTQLYWLAFFPLLPMIVGVMQYAFPDIPVFIVSIAICSLNVILEQQKTLISIDPLTKMNNRNQLLNYAQNKIRNFSQFGSIYLVMMDLNYFKQINDKFGHLEGDRALIEVSEVLKKNCPTRSDFVGRYGGDEFIMIIHDCTDSQIDELAAKINRDLEAFTKENNKQYKLSVGYGYARFISEMSSLQDLIKAADDKLYEYKRNRK